MISCAHVEEIEELAMGLLEDAEAIAHAKAHLETCSICVAAHDDLIEERALFEARGEELAARTEIFAHMHAHPHAHAHAQKSDALPAFLPLHFFDAVDQEEAPRPLHARITPAFVALAAAAAMFFVGIGQIERSTGPTTTTGASRPTLRATEATPLSHQGAASAANDSFLGNNNKSDDACRSEESKTWGGGSRVNDDELTFACGDGLTTSSTSSSSSSSGVVQIAQHAGLASRTIASSSSLHAHASESSSASSSLCEVSSSSAGPDIAAIVQDRGLCEDRVTSSVATP